MRHRRLVIAVVVTALGGPAAVVGIVRSHAHDVATAVPTVIVPTTSQVRQAQAFIGKVAVKGRGPKTGYSRSQFGDGWANVGKCDTRDLILARDLTDDQTQGCEVLAGRYPREPYTGKAMTYQHGGTYAHELDIDHRYPLSLAWQEGASRWTTAKRIKFANDPLNLVASDPSANRQKGDSGPASWLPVKASRCDYLATFTLVAYHYGLPMNPPDHTVTERILRTC